MGDLTMRFNENKHDGKNLDPSDGEGGSGQHTRVVTEEVEVPRASSGTSKLALTLAIFGFAGVIANYYLGSEKDRKQDISFGAQDSTLSAQIDYIHSGMDNISDDLSSKLDVAVVKVGESYVWTENAAELEKANREIRSIQGQLVIYDTKLDSVISQLRPMPAYMQGLVSNLEQTMESQNEDYSSRLLNLQGRVDSLSARFLRAASGTEEVLEVPMVYSSIDSVNTLVDKHNDTYHKGVFKWKLGGINEKAYNATQKIIGPDADAKRVFDHYKNNTQIRRGSQLHTATHATCGK